MSMEGRRESISPRDLTRRRAIAALAAAVLVGLAGTATVFAATPVQVRGTVIDAQGTPVDGAMVEVVGTGGHLDSTRADSLGRFSIAGGHRVGATDLLVSAAGFAPARVRASASRVIIHRWPMVIGVVRDDEGSPVPDATARLQRDQGKSALTTSADSAGNFSFGGPVEPGIYHLSISATYHHPYKTAFALAYDKTVRPAPVVMRHLAVVSISSQPQGQQPLLDGAPLPGCQRTPCTAPIPAGPHQLSIESELTVPWWVEVWPGKGDLLTFNPVLERRTGTLRVIVPDVPGAELRVDGSTVGAGSWSGQLPTGDHRIEFTSARTWPFSGKVRVDWNVESEYRVSPVQVVRGDAAAFMNGLDAYLGGLDGRYGLYMVQLGGGLELGYGEGNSMDAASVIKLPVALYAYQQFEAGAIKPDDQVTLEDGDFLSGSGLLYYQNQPGDTFTYFQLVRLMIQQSDNTAWRALLRMLGAERVDAYAASLGAPDCIQASDRCTPRAAGRLLVHLAAGAALNQADTQALIGLLETTVFNDRINSYLGDIPVAHKVGMRGGVINDAGIVFLAGNPFVISMFSETDDPDGGKQAIRDVARAAAAFYGR